MDPKGELTMFISRREVLAGMTALAVSPSGALGQSPAPKKLKMIVNTSHRKSHINRELYGHFIEQDGRVIYDGLFVGRKSKIPNVGGVRRDVIEALREVEAPMLHWPGGWRAETYHWRDGIGNSEHRARTITPRPGGLIDDNSFGTHEFFDLCEELGAEPYLVTNVGSGTVQEAADWVEYITYPGNSDMAQLRRRNGRDKPWNLKYICVGNEWYGYETAAAFAVSFKRHNTFIRNYGPEPMKRLLRGPQHRDHDVAAEIVSLVQPGTFDALTLYQIIPSVRRGNPMLTGKSDEFSDDEYYFTLANALDLDASITRHIGIVRSRDGNQHAKLAIDEWGTWYQRSDPNTLWSMHVTMRDALVQAAVLNIFNQRSDVLLLCTLCMPINALSSILHTSGPHLVKTPAFYVHKMYRGHQGATLIDSSLDNDRLQVAAESLPAVSHSVSRKDDRLLITMVNCSLERDYLIDCDLMAGEYALSDAEILHASDVRARNHFDRPDNVISRPFDRVRQENKALLIELPRCSVIAVRLRAVSAKTAASAS
jgi:alpha-N-arabinofuranosidase